MLTFPRVDYCPDVVNAAVCIDVSVSCVVGGELEVAERAALIQVEHSHTLQGRRSEVTKESVHTYIHVITSITSKRGLRLRLLCFAH